MLCVGLAILLFLVVSMHFADRYVLGALRCEAQRGRVRPQFTLADAFALLVLAQLILAALYSLTPEQGWVRPAVMGLGLFLAVLLWCRAVQRLTAAGIHRAGHRFWFIAVIYPIAVVGVLAGLCMACLMAAGLVFILGGNRTYPLAIGFSPCVLGAIVLMLTGLARFVRDMVDVSRRTQPGATETSTEPRPRNAGRPSLADAPTNDACEVRPDRSPTERHTR